jgi:putative hydrolase of the HAD superfamily
VSVTTFTLATDEICGRVGGGDRYRAVAVGSSTGIDAVIFDWGGTLTAWHDVDFHAESLALAQAVRAHPEGPEVSVRRLHLANQAVWGRSRDHQQSATIADLFAEAGLEHDPELLVAYHDFWEPHTITDPEVGPLWRALRERGIRVGVLSNTIWPRAWHRRFFERDGVVDLIDGDVYTSEIPWTKPSPKAFAAALEAVGASDPARCVYVGDRLFDDVWGSQEAGMRAIHLPHSTIPPEQLGHTEGRPDAVVQGLAEVLDVVAGWSGG